MSLYYNGYLVPELPLEPPDCWQQHEYDNECQSAVPFEIEGVRRSFISPGGESICLILTETE